MHRKYGKSAIYNLNDVVLLAPIACPPKIICLGLNYYDHAAEQEAEISDEPVIFMKPCTAITGPNQPIIKPGFVERLDYEVELAVVIGKKGKKIPVEEAKGYIFGYTIINTFQPATFNSKIGNGLVERASILSLQWGHA